jgi:hypothetical protein
MRGRVFVDLLHRAGPVRSPRKYEGPS